MLRSRVISLPTSLICARRHSQGHVKTENEADEAPRQENDGTTQILPHQTPSVLCLLLVIMGRDRRFQRLRRDATLKQKRCVRLAEKRNPNDSRNTSDACNKNENPFPPNGLGDITTPEESQYQPVAFGARAGYTYIIGPTTGPSRGPAL